MRHIVLYDRWSVANEVQLKNGSSERKVRAEGWFHCWQQAADEDGSGPVAVVELDDGHVETWDASHVGFDRVERGTTNIVALQDQVDVLVEALEDIWVNATADFHLWPDGEIKLLLRQVLTRAQVALVQAGRISNDPATGAAAGDTDG